VIGPDTGATGSRPKIAVLDEMTTGLDPQARRDAWQLIERMRDRGTTILLVTHFMDEAERLCDRVALVDNGRIVALDSPASLAARARGGKVVRFVPSRPFDDRLLRVLPDVAQVERQGQHVIVTGTGDLVSTVILGLAAAGISAYDVQLDASNLEDVFVRLTGSHLNEEGALFFPMMFFAGLWLPRALMPPVLLDISNYTPLRAAVQAMQYSTLHGFPPAAPMLVLLAYALVFGFLAKRFFRWE
jgi:hypothetical protein